MFRCSAIARIGNVANLLLPCLALCAPFTYIRNETTNQVSVIDAADGTLVATQTGTGITVNLAETRVYVLTRRKASVIDTRTGAIIATVPPSRGNGIAVNAAGTRVDAATELLNSVSVVYTATNAVIALLVVADPSSITGAAVNSAGTRVYIADARGNVVIVLELASNLAAPSVGVERTPFAIVQSIDADGEDSAPDLNQHGFTGSWYDPATSGQGFAVEVFPNQTSGNGQAVLSWFTFHPVQGGPERQRWYTLQGQVTSGQQSASLRIYQNTGGNFNAPPATNAHAVGTATLSFSTCSTGNLSYSFTDGSDRAGTIRLTRLLPNVTCSATTEYPTDADFAYSGGWYGGASTSGQGFAAEVTPNAGALFLSWFTYRPDGVNAGASAQRWYTAQGAFSRGTRTIPVQIYETTGGKFDSPTPPGQHTVPVGTGTMAFQSCSAATFTYNFTGGSSAGSSGTVNLSRVGPVPPGCTS